MSSFFLLQHYGCFCRSSSSLLLLLESAGHLCSHKVPIIQMMSHMSVADKRNAKQFISRYSPESLPVWPWKMCLKAAERMPPKQPCTNRDCFIWIWTSTCRNKRHKCSYCSWNWIDIRLYSLMAYSLYMSSHMPLDCICDGSFPSSRPSMTFFMQECYPATINLPLVPHWAVLLPLV